jgi:hypothetical protein
MCVCALLKSNIITHTHLVQRMARHESVHINDVSLYAVFRNDSGRTSSCDVLSRCHFRDLISSFAGNGDNCLGARRGTSSSNHLWSNCSADADGRPMCYIKSTRKLVEEWERSTRKYANCAACALVRIAIVNIGHL